MEGVRTWCLRGRVAKRRVLILLVGLAVAPWAMALSAGDPDSMGRHPEVVALRSEQSGLCSAVKIEARTLLTAAHCLIDARTGALWPAFRAGRRVSLDNAARQRTGAEAISAVISRIDLPPAYREGLERFAAYRRRRLAELSANASSLPAAKLEQGLRLRHHFAARYPDVALMRLQTTTPSIPVKPVAFTPLQAGTEVELVGFGCAEPGAAGKAYPAVRRVGRSQVIRVDRVSFYTQAGQRSADAPSLCPGDSGGPVLHQGQVVGIHTVVYGLNARHGARSNMAVNLSALADWSAWPP